MKRDRTTRCFACRRATYVRTSCKTSTTYPNTNGWRSSTSSRSTRTSSPANRWTVRHGSAVPRQKPRSNDPANARPNPTTSAALRPGRADVVAAERVVVTHVRTGVRRVDHLPITDVDADVMNGARIAGVVGEENEVTRTQFET